MQVNKRLNKGVIRIYGAAIIVALLAIVITFFSAPKATVGAICQDSSDVQAQHKTENGSHLEVWVDDTYIGLARCVVGYSYEFVFSVTKQSIADSGITIEGKTFELDTVWATDITTNDATQISDNIAFRLLKDTIEIVIPSVANACVRAGFYSFATPAMFTATFECHGVYTTQQVQSGGYVKIPTITCTYCAGNPPNPFSYWSISGAPGKYSNESLRSYAINQNVTITVHYLERYTVSFACADGHAQGDYLFMGDALEGAKCPIPANPCANVVHEGMVAMYICNGDQSKLYTVAEITAKIVNNPLTFTAVWVHTMPPDPVREGYIFDGWFTDEALTQPYDPSVPITSDMTLYAKWTIQTFTVTFVTGKTWTVPEVSAVYNTAIVLPEMTETGYTFDGWFTDAALTQAYKADAPVVGDMTLYAKWTIKMYTVTFVVDGETYHTVTVPYGTTLTEALKQAGLPYYAIGSIVTESGDAGDGETVTETMTVTLSEASVPNKILTFLRLNWIYLTCGAGGLILLIGVGVAIAKKKKA